MLSAIAADVWALEHGLALPGRVRLPVRMTVVRLPGGELLLHAPVPISDEVAGAIERLGTVRHVVAPSLLHHLYVRPCLERYPGAALHGAPGLPEKRPRLRWDGVLGGDQPAPPWAAVLEPLPLEGAPRVNEVAFLHHPSGTLLVTDLLFNVDRPETLATALTLRLMGTYRRLAMSRAWRLAVKDRPAFRVSVERLLARPFVRIVPGHGDVFESPEARERARAALGWAAR